MVILATPTVCEVVSLCVDLIFMLTKLGLRMKINYITLSRIEFWISCILNVNIQFGLSWVLQSLYQNAKIRIKYNDNY